SSWTGHSADEAGRLDPAADHADRIRIRPARLDRRICLPGASVRGDAARRRRRRAGPLPRIPRARSLGTAPWTQGAGVACIEPVAVLVAVARRCWRTAHLSDRDPVRSCPPYGWRWYPGSRVRSGDGGHVAGNRVLHSNDLREPEADQAVAQLTYRARLSDLRSVLRRSAFRLAAYGAARDAGSDRPHRGHDGSGRAACEACLLASRRRADSAGESGRRDRPAAGRGGAAPGCTSFHRELCPPRDGLCDRTAA